MPNELLVWFGLHRLPLTSQTYHCTRPLLFHLHPSSILWLPPLIFSTLGSIPKSFWCSFLPKKHNLSCIILHVWKEYAFYLYNALNQMPSFFICCTPTIDFFSLVLIHIAIQRLNLGEALDIENLKAEFLKHAKFTPPSFVSSSTMSFAWVSPLLGP